MIFKKKDFIKQTSGCQGKGMVREFGTAMYALLSEVDHQQGPAGQHSGSAQCCVAAWMGGRLGRMGTRTCMTESLCCSPETITAF